MKKGDWLISALVFLTGLAILITPFLGSGEQVCIYQGEELVASCSLHSENIFPIEVSDGIFEVTVSGGQAFVSRCDCSEPSHHQGAVSHPGQSLVCLPYQIIVTVEGKGSLDAISF